jgi:hypothetical protein
MIAETQNIRDLRRWVCWRTEERDGKPTKVPYSPLTGERASSTNPETWASHQEAVKACKEHGYSGIGITFTAEDDLCGVDLDSCLNPETKEIEDWAQEIIGELDSYTEISPSGRGVHILVRAELPPGRNRKGRFEAYDRGRYFTVTSRHLEGMPKTIEDRQEQLRSVVRRVLGDLETTNGHKVAGGRPRFSAPQSDEAVIEKARAENGGKLDRLWHGDMSDYGHDHSAADDGFVHKLYSYTQDEEQIKRIHAMSSLHRAEKSGKRDDYLQRSIERARTNTTWFYEWPKTVKLKNSTETVGPEEKEERRNQADRQIGYALEDAEALFVDQHSAPHALVGGEPLPLNSRCYSWLRRLMWAHEERAVNGEHLKTAAGTLAAHAEFSGEVRELHTRCAWYQDALYYELGPGRVVKVDAVGWRFDPNPPVLFRRFPNLKPLPDPQSGGDAKALADYANLKTNRDKRLFIAYAVTVPPPHVGRPILNASGAMGSGKTTIGRVLKRLLDPTAPETIRFDPRDFLQKAAHAYVVMLDNQNTIPEWAADTLCRLVTGEADSKRRLYTDDEDVIVELRRAVLLNGINVPTDRGDVLDRSLVVELERIPDGERRTEEELWERFEAEHPKLLGALFDVLAKAIALKPSIKLSRRPRLADWGEYAAAVYEVMDWGAETFLKDWDEVVKVQNQATLDGSPVAQAIIKFMEDKDEYTGTSSELHKKLEGIAEDLGVSIVRDKAWPKSARWLWRRIKEVLPLLVASGIEAGRVEDRTGSKITLRKLPKDDATNATEDESGEGKAKTGGIKPDDDATANATGNTDSYASSGNSGNRYGDTWQSDPMRAYRQGGAA